MRTEQVPYSIINLSHQWNQLPPSENVVVQKIKKLTSELCETYDVATIQEITLDILDSLQEDSIIRNLSNSEFKRKDPDNPFLMILPFFLSDLAVKLQELKTPLDFHTITLHHTENYSKVSSPSYTYLDFFNDWNTLPENTGNHATFFHNLKTLTSQLAAPSNLAMDPLEVIINSILKLIAENCEERTRVGDIEPSNDPDEAFLNKFFAFLGVYGMKKKQITSVEDFQKITSDDIEHYSEDLNLLCLSKVQKETVDDSFDDDSDEVYVCNRYRFDDTSSEKKAFEEILFKDIEAYLIKKQLLPLSKEEGFCTNEAEESLLKSRKPYKDYSGVTGQYVVDDVKKIGENLTALNISSIVFSENEFKELIQNLPNLKHLKYFVFNGEFLSFDPLQALLSSENVDLISLELDYAMVTPESIENISRSMPKLKKLALINCEIFSSEILRMIATSLPHLSTLYLDWNLIGDKGLKALLEGFGEESKLKRLSLDGNLDITHTAAEHIANAVYLKKLKTLKLNFTEINSDSFSKIVTSPNLRLKNLAVRDNDIKNFINLETDEECSLDTLEHLLISGNIIKLNDNRFKNLKSVSDEFLSQSVYY